MYLLNYLSIFPLSVLLFLPFVTFPSSSSLFRSVVRKHEALQKQLEKTEETVSTKAEARDALLKDVSTVQIVSD